MKKVILMALFALVGVAATAQNYIVVNSEKIFKSLDSYNKAITQLDELAESYKQQVNAKFEEVESLFATYERQRTALSAAARQSFENQILQKEKDANAYQESLFGQEGELMKRRVALIKPIQERVFAAIEAYAKQTGAEVVIDSSNNPTLLYTAPSAERTDEVIKSLK